jgi:hypothetical protein
MEVSGQLHGLTALPMGERDCTCPLDRILGGPQTDLDAVAKRKIRIIAPAEGFVEIQ